MDCTTEHLYFSQSMEWGSSQNFTLQPVNPWKKSMNRTGPKSILVYSHWVNPKPLHCSSAPCIGSLQNFGAKSCLLTIVLPQSNPPHPPPCHPPWSSPPLSLSTLSNCRSFRHGLPERLTFVRCISQFSNTRWPPPLLTRNQRGPARRRCLQCNLLSDDRC